MGDKIVLYDVKLSLDIISDIEKNIIRNIGLIVSMICFIISDIDFNIDREKIIN